MSSILLQKGYIMDQNEVNQTEQQADVDESRKAAEADIERFASRLEAQEDFRKIFKNQDPRHIHLGATHFVVKQIISKVMPTMPSFLARMMADNIFTEHATSHGYTEEEATAFANTDPHDLFAMDAIKERCEECEKKDSCEAYQKSKANS